ncbi:hypothetical protein HYX01_04545 [Candidatus Woesearchaeota archaeon]|nr:hypothetical protein [Candidatus Woesearchaeota archaeon]
MEEKDDEISFDLSKIKGFFKRKEDKEKASTETKTDNQAPKEHPQPAPPTKKSEGETKNEDEISIDFSKIKNLFKKEHFKPSDEDKDIAINWQKTAGFFRKYGVFFIVLIPIILSVYIRMQADSLYVADRWAEESAINNLRSQVKAGIDQQYPNLPEQNKNALVDKQMQKVIADNKAQIDQNIRGTSNFIKSYFQDENGYTYMPDIDPYYWYRYAKNIVEHGYPGDILKDGKSWDTYQIAPVGRPVTEDMFHGYFLAYFYKSLRLFALNITLMRAISYYPVFISALSVLLVFLIARKIAGNMAAFFAALMIAVGSTQFLGRTLFGHADSDAWVVFFPLLITWLFMEAIESKGALKIIFISTLAGFFTGLYTFAWSGWWYIFDFLIITVIATLGYLILVNFKDAINNPKTLFSNLSIRNEAIVLVIYFISTAFFVTIISGWDIFTGSFTGPLSFPSIKAPVNPSLWPNVLTTVAELNEGAIKQVVESVGGASFFFISLIGLVLAISRKQGLKLFDFFYIIGAAIFYGLLFAKFGNNKPLYQSISIFSLLIWIMLPIIISIIISIYKKDSSYDFRLSILLSLWMSSTIFASIKGIRFTLLLAPAFSVAFGVAFGRLYTYLSELLTKELKIYKPIVSTVLIVLLLPVYINPTQAAINGARSDLPIINDAWYNSLNKIKTNSSKDAIITSWWDFGHHFKALADRKVTFDGTTQTTVPAHWVGKFFLTSDEQQALGILRMLDCGSSSAFHTLNKAVNDTHLALKILNEIILLDKESAEKRLKDYNLNKEKIENVTSFTHCNPPDAYVIASEDMIGKSGVWSHFGSWNFERADIWQNARKMPLEEATSYLIKKFNYTKEQAESVYFEVQGITSDSEANSWVAPWPGYAGTTTCKKSNNEHEYVCPPIGIGKDNNGKDVAATFYINLSSYNVFGIIQGTSNIVNASAVAFTTENGILKKQFKGNTIGYGFTLIPKNENELLAVISSKELTGSIFTRLFFMQGHGLRYFKLLTREKGLTGTDIYVYKVDWEGREKTIADSIKEAIEKEKLISLPKLNITTTSNEILIVNGTTNKT